MDVMEVFNKTLKDSPETPHCACGRWQYLNGGWRRAAVRTNGRTTDINIRFPAGNERNRCKDCKQDLTKGPEETTR